MKFFFLIAASLLSLGAMASLNKSDVVKALAGQYRFKLESGNHVAFIIRSSGEAQIISANNDYKEVKISLEGSNSSSHMKGLPVAHVILSEGSDEDITDHHFLLTATGEGKDLTVEKLASFTTFNDGPNDLASSGGVSALSRYDVVTKKWLELK